MLTRSSFLAGTAASVAIPAAGPFASLERRSGGRLGICALDLRDGRRVMYRAAERFPLASTFKAPLVIATLARVDRSRERLDRPIAIPARGLVPFSPDTAAHRGGVLTVGELCTAAIERSDNTAANLLLRELGGPASLTAYLRRLGDAVTRVDRYEPALSEARPGDPRDTTTPAAMTELLRDLTARRVLSDASTGRLVGWMRAATTGLTRIRAGIARGWDVADKTGTTGSGRADIAIVSPPSGAQLLIAVYLAECAAADATQDAALAAAARLAVHALRG